MRLFIASRWRLLLGVLVLVQSAGAAAQPDAALADAAASLHAQVLRWQQMHAPGAVLYVAAPKLQPELRLIEVFVDQAPAQRYRFSEIEAAALREGMRQRLPLDALSAGRHQLRIHAVAREPGSQNREAAIDTVLEQSLTLPAPDGVLELVLTQEGSFAAARLRLRSLEDADARSEARQRYAAFLDASGQSFAAEAERRLLQMQNSAPSDTNAAAAPDHDGILLARYQRALSALAADESGAEAQLEQLNQEPLRSELALALRDQANLSLAYRDLRAQRGEQAIARLQRIRSPGPCDNAALLALGWAYLLPRGAAGAAQDREATVSLRPVGEDAVAQARRLTPFRYRQAVAEGERGEDIRRALVPWEELIGRDALDPAVQEGMLALPYALDHFGAHEQALQYYQRAIVQLQALRARLTAAQAQLDSGELLALLDARDGDRDGGWSRLLVDRREDQEAVPLRLMRRDAALAAAMQAHRDTAAISRALAQDAERLRASSQVQASSLLGEVDAMQTQLQARLREEDARFAPLAQRWLRSLDAQSQVYLAEAHFALARANDRLPGAPSYGAAP